jgi:hypothetical protein
MFLSSQATNGERLGREVYCRRFIHPPNLQLMNDECLPKHNDDPQGIHGQERVAHRHRWRGEVKAAQ